jgi:hypothetical protein
MATNLPTGSQSVKNMISIGEWLTSNVVAGDGVEDDLTKFGLLYDTSLSFSKIVGVGAGGLLDTTAQIQATPLIIKIAAGVYIADMENFFLQGNPFPNITIVKLGNIDGENKLREKTIFTDCYVLKMQPSSDPKTSMTYNTLSLRFTTYTNTIYVYKDIEGTPAGQTAVFYDFSKNTSKSDA